MALIDDLLLDPLLVLCLPSSLKELAPGWLGVLDTPDFEFAAALILGSGMEPGGGPLLGLEVTIGFLPRRR